MRPLVLGAGLVFFAGVVLIGVGIAGPRRRTRAPLAPGATLRDLLPTVKAGDEQNLRLAGITPESYATQRFGGLMGGLVLGALVSVLWGRGPAGTVAVVGLLGAGGWLLPMMGVRDTAKKARAELDQVVRVWIALVAQQVAAGTDPNVAMLAAARAGRRNSWRLLHRFLLAAQQERRPAWGGLSDMVDRYGIHSLAPVVSALGLAAERGTRISEAVLAAANTLWRRHHRPRAREGRPPVADHRDARHRRGVGAGRDPDLPPPSPPSPEAAVSGAFPDGRSRARRTRQPAADPAASHGRRAAGQSSGLITLEWLLIVGAIAGLAASSVLIVQRVVNDQTDVPDDPVVRMLEADIAAAAVAAEAQAAYDDNPPGYAADPVFESRCNSVGGDFSDVVDGAARWVSPAGPDRTGGNGDDEPARCTVNAAAGPRGIGDRGGGGQQRDWHAREQGLGPEPPR